MSMKKLTAGSGYDYLIRQVAAQDATVGAGLAAYYEQRGEAPGEWIGAGLVGLDGISAGDPVTEAQMRALFGAGLHPLADEIRQTALEAGLSGREAEQLVRLGKPFAERAGGSSAFQQELRARYAAANLAAGRPASARLDPEVRSRIRSEVAGEFFVREFGRRPASPIELHGAVARWSRPAAATIAGFDVTFSPVKSVSTLWAVADLRTSRVIEQVHLDAVGKALAYLETQLFTRVGAQGVRQVDVHGMVAAAFTHRDSRAGDPDLHTHVAVANKVQTLDGRWLAIDASVLYRAKVTASETYNTALEAGLTEALGVRFVERASTSGKRPVREVAGVDAGLNARWSTRRAQIEQRRDVLAAVFLADHGRPPTEAEMIALAQQANLETRDGKHPPRSLAEQRATWRTQATEVLSADGIQRMLRTVLHQAPVAPEPPSLTWLITTSAAVIGVLEQERSTWQVWHVRAEAERQVRTAGIAPALIERVVDTLVDLAIETRSVPLTLEEPIAEPDALRRASGESVYTAHGAARYTSSRILEAEQRILAHAARTGGRAVPEGVVDLALLEALANGTHLTAGQRDLVRSMTGSGRRVQLAIAPAGTGKTTAMRTLAAAWTETGGTVLGLAPSAAAATALADQLDAPCDTLAKLTWTLEHPDQPQPAWMAGIGLGSLVIIDEAGMADTLTLDHAIDHIISRGGSVRLIGDDRQLSAVGAGGVLRDIEAAHGACRLTEVLRFTDPAEAAATLALRDGRPEALGFYLDQQRIHVGDLASLTEQVLQAWTSDCEQGLDAIMLAPTRDLVSDLNRLAQQQRHLGRQHRPAVALRDGNSCSVGDVVITRHNNRRLTVGNSDWVKNGDRWHVTAVAPDGSVRAQSLRSRYTVTLPADYVRDWVDLGYATTIHGAQGVTADTMHGLATGDESRQQTYTMLTRGRHANHLYLQVVGDGDPHTLAHTDTVYLTTAVERLEGMLGRDDAPESATTQLRDQDDPARLLGPAVARFTDALGFAAEQVLGTHTVTALEDAADQVVLWISDSPAWPTLRTHLMRLTADGHNPVALLRQAANRGELDTAHDPAAVLDHRLDTLLPPGPAGPLPWLPPIPTRIAADPLWGPYLQARADRVDALADAVRATAALADVPPTWLGETPTFLTNEQIADLTGDVAVWRSATNVPPTEERPTGDPADGGAAARWQQALNARVDHAIGTQAGTWARILPTLDPAIARDPARLTIARRLHELERDGADTRALVRQALTQGELPDEHAAAALWWRVTSLAHQPKTRSEPPPGWGWEIIKDPPKRRPEHDPRPGHDPGRRGPSLGF